MTGLQRLNKLQVKNILDNILQLFIGLAIVAILLKFPGIFVGIEISGLNKSIVLENAVFWGMSIFMFAMAIDLSSKVGIYILSGITRKAVFIANSISMVILSVISSGVVTLGFKFLVPEIKNTIYELLNISSNFELFFKLLLLYLVLFSLSSFLGYSFRHSIRVFVITLIAYIVILNIFILIYNLKYIGVGNLQYFVGGALLLVISLICNKIMLDKI